MGFSIVRHQPSTAMSWEQVMKKMTKIMAVNAPTSGINSPLDVRGIAKTCRWQKFQNFTSSSIEESLFVTFDKYLDSLPPSKIVIY